MKSQRIAWSCLQTARSSSTENTCKHILPRHNEGFAITAQPVQAASGSEEQRLWCYPQLKYSHQASHSVNKKSWLARSPQQAIHYQRLSRSVSVYQQRKGSRCKIEVTDSFAIEIIASFLLDWLLMVLVQDRSVVNHSVNPRLRMDKCYKIA